MQFLLGWLCLICFGLSSTIFSGGLVLCQNVGGPRIEWGCAKNAHGECDAQSVADSNDDEHPQPQPCEDTPLLCDGVAKLSFRQADQPTVPPGALVAVLAFLTDRAPPGHQIGSSAVRDRPPNWPAHIKTVILIL